MCFSSSVPHNWSSRVLTHCFPSHLQESFPCCLGEGMLLSNFHLSSPIIQTWVPPTPFLLLLFLLFLLQWSAKISIWEGWTYYYFLKALSSICLPKAALSRFSTTKAERDWSPFARSCWFHNL